MDWINPNARTSKQAVDHRRTFISWHLCADQQSWCQFKAVGRSTGCSAENVQNCRVLNKARVQNRTLAPETHTVYQRKQGSGQRPEPCQVDTIGHSVHEKPLHHHALLAVVRPVPPDDRLLTNATSAMSGSQSRFPGRDYRAPVNS